ncbi:MAG UNVERIFIED_CONTAM: glycosyltransferase [Planctomycetaceae bacterium]
MRPLTILQLIPALESGGAERCVADVSRALVEAGHRSLVASAGGRLAEQIRADGGEHVPLATGRKSPLVLGVIPSLRRLLLRQPCRRGGCALATARMDHASGTEDSAAANRPAVVATVHGLNSASFYSRVMLRADAVVAVSDSVREHLRRMAPSTDQRHVRVIRRGVDAAEFPRGWRPAVEWREAFEGQFPELRGRLWLTLAGRLVRTKGHADLLRLTAVLRRDQMPVQALVVGDTAGRSDYVAELRRLAGSLGVAEHLTFAGHRGDVRDVYAASAVVLTLSHKPESFGLATAEALSLGIPVVGLLPWWDV